MLPLIIISKSAILPTLNKSAILLTSEKVEVLSKRITLVFYQCSIIVCPTSVKERCQVDLCMVHDIPLSQALRKLDPFTLLLCMDPSCGTSEGSVSIRYQSGGACYIGDFQCDFLNSEFLVRDPNRAGQDPTFVKTQS